MGRDFLGTYYQFADALSPFERGVYNSGAMARRPEVALVIAEKCARQIARGGRDGEWVARPPFDSEAYCERHLTSPFFSAVRLGARNRHQSGMGL
jgi:hypothetical protein